MKTTIKIVLVIALITALCGCTAKADVPTKTDKEPALAETASKDTSTDAEDNETTLVDSNKPDEVTDAEVKVESEANATATPKPTATAESETTPQPEASDQDDDTPTSKPTAKPTTAPTAAPTSKPTAKPTTAPAETIAKPTISISPTDTTRDPITVTITAPAEATMVKYQIDNLGYSVYSGPFTVSGNCKITAFAATHTLMSEYVTRTITNYDSSPDPTPELTVSSAGSSYMQAVANAINAAKEADGKSTATVHYGGGAQSDAENILLGTQSGPSGLANMVRGNYSGTGAGNALAFGVLMDASNIKIGAAKSSTGEYCVVVGYW